MGGFAVPAINEVVEGFPLIRVLVKSHFVFSIFACLRASLLKISQRPRHPVVSWFAIDLSLQDCLWHCIDSFPGCITTRKCIHKTIVMP